MMKKLLGIVVLCFILNGCAPDYTGYGEWHREYNKKKNEKSLNCKKEVKDIIGSEAIEKYEECLKRK